jgi:type VI secretion system protein ImpA
MDLTAFLEARMGEGPSGENLEYDHEFMQLQIAAQPGEEKQAGADIIAASEPDYRDVATRATAVLERAHDLRAAVMLAAAVLNTEGLSGFVEVLAYIRGCLERYWDTCHPQLDADDDNDPTMRINALQGLSDRAGVMAASAPVMVALRRTPLTNSRNFGRFGLRDILIASGELTAADGQAGVDRATVAAAFADSGDLANGQTLDRIKQAQDHVKAIEAVFSRQTPGYGPDLDELRRMLSVMARHVGEHVSQAVETGADNDAASDQGGTSGPSARVATTLRRAGGAVAAIQGSIETAEDARAALQQVIVFFQTYEPSSPVPLILERAKRLVGADFITIMKDMAPSGLDSVNMIGGIDGDQDD